MVPQVQKFREGRVGGGVGPAALGHGPGEECIKQAAQGRGVTPTRENGVAPWGLAISPKLMGATSLHIEKSVLRVRDHRCVLL